MLPRGQGGITALPGYPSFAPPTERVIGNGNPMWTGSPGDNPNKPGPHPVTQQMGGNTGNFDGSSGADPAVAKIQPDNRRFPGSRQGGEAQNERTNSSGLTGFNNRLQVRDRHAYWDTGNQRSGLVGAPWGLPNTYNPDLLKEKPTPELRLVNISVNPMIGSNASRNQDDLSRPYTWLGQWDGSTQPVYGGVPGLWQSYGNRGFSYNIHDPSNGQGGPQEVLSGPPHGLHSDTIPSGKQIADRYRATPQMRPVRFDRPDNSTSAGQSYSQTVQMQGQPASGMRRASTGGISMRTGTRNWGGGGVK